MVNKINYEKLGKEKVEETVDRMGPTLGNGLGIIAEGGTGAATIMVGIKYADPYAIGVGIPLISDTVYRLYRVYKVEKYTDKLKGYLKEAGIIEDKEENKE